MSLKQKTHETKPYNVCIDCIHIGQDCDGPNFLAMTPERWCEWCHLRKEYLDLTNAEIAEIAGVSEISVARVMSGHVKDIRVTTMQAVTKALVNGSWGQYPCALASASGKEVNSAALIEQCKQLQTTLDSIKAEHKAEIAEIRNFEQSRLDYLKEQLNFEEKQVIIKDNMISDYCKTLKQRNRVIFCLALLLGISVAAITLLL